MSGSPRSRMIRSGCLSVTHLSASAPVSASCTTKPSSSRPARRKRRICTSSSITRTTGAGSVIRSGLELGGVGGERQVDRYRGSLVGAGAVRFDLAAVGDHEGFAIHSGSPEPDVVLVWRGPRKKRSPRRSLFSVRQTGAGVVDRQDQVVAVAPRSTLMVEPLGEYLAALSIARERLFHQNWGPHR